MSAVVRMFGFWYRKVFVALVFLGAMLAPIRAQSQTVAPSRPILFVHGWCGSAFDWAPLNKYIFANLPTTMYPNHTVYVIEYDALNDSFGYWTEDDPYGTSGQLTAILKSSIPSDARLFAIEFLDPNGSSTDPSNVTKISVLNKAYELSQVIKQILSITQASSVNIVAHSMGGLDSRAYVESMASPGQCYNYVAGSPQPTSWSTPQYSGTCNPGGPGAAFADDVANIITIDTPHAGSPLATANGLLQLLSSLNLENSCQAYESTNMAELLPQSLGGAGLIELLNFDGSMIQGVAPKPNSVPIQAVEDYFASVYSNNWNSLQGESDDIVQVTSQSIRANLPPGDSTASLADIPVGYASNDTGIAATSACWATPGDVFPLLHPMTCLGAQNSTQQVVNNQLINDTVPWVSSWTVTPTTLTLGEGVAISYTATDLSTSTLSRAELWRAPDVGNQPGTWAEVYSSYSPQTLSGNAAPVVFVDTPTASGKYWYGTHLFDAAGNQMNEPQSVQVTVNAPDQVLTVTSLGGGTVISNDGYINCGSSCTHGYANGTSVTLTAASESGWAFGSWSGCSTRTGTSCIVNMTAARAVTATFTQSGANDTLTVSATGSGTISSSDGLISCGTNCSHAYASGTTVTLNAAPSSGWSFNSWGGACSGANSCTVILSATSTAATATFTQNAVNYSVNISEGGSGTVSSNDGYINCGSTCTHTYAAGTNVTLNAYPASGWNFSGWSGACGGVSSCALTVNGIENVVAVFSQNATGTIYHITGQVLYNGVGLSNVLMSISGGTNGGTYTDSNGDYNVSLAAGGYNITPVLAGYSFNPGALSIQLSSNTTQNFTASLTTYSLTVTEQTFGTGSGTVTSQPSGITCTTPSCSATYTGGTPVALTATPSGGSVFVGWTGACQGVGQCVVSMTQNQSVQATFSSSSGGALMMLSPGPITTIAGNGADGASGDGGPASLATVNTPYGTAEDNNGNVYFADFGGNRIRVVNTQTTPITIGGIAIQPGNIATLAGNGNGGFSGDNGPSALAEIYGPTAIRFDASGNLYFVDASNYRIRVINLETVPITVAGISVQPGTIMTVAGNGTVGSTPDGSSATSAALANPKDVLIDNAGNIYFTEHLKVRIVNANTGVLGTLAGGGSGQCSTQLDGQGDGCPAAQAVVAVPTSLAMDSFGNIFFADTQVLNAIRMVYKGGTFPGLPSNPVSGYIYAIAGRGSGCTGQSDVAGDGCAIGNSTAITGSGLSIDSAGSLYFANSNDSRIHRVDRSSGLMTAVAGNGTSGYLEDGVPATSTEISFESAYGNVLSIDPRGNLFFADSNTYRVREISSLGAPLFLLSPSVGTQGSGQTLTVINAGTAIMVEPTFSFGGTDPSEFSETNTCSSTIPPGASCTVTVVFTPAASGMRAAELIVAGSNSQNSPQTVELSGSEVAPAGVISLGSASLSFPSQPVGSASAGQTVLITNTGAAEMPAPAFAISGTGANLFSLASACQTVIQVGQNCSVGISFAPSTVGAATATLTVTDVAASNSPQQVSLNGAGAQATPFVTWFPSVSSLTYGAPLSASVLNATASANGSSVAGTFAYTATISGGSSQSVSQSTVLVAGIYAITATFTPTDSTDYASVTSSISFSVAAQTAPTITFAVPNHTYGDSPFTVSATSNSSGAITYSVVSGPATVSGSTMTLTGAGTVVLQASQAASSNYAAGTQTATFTVAGETPTISFTVPNHTYGDAPFAVTATSNSGGAITYSVVSGPATISTSTVTLTGAGTVVLQATQTAAGNYSSGTQTSTFTVAGAVPTISFTVPTHTYGDAPFTVSATSNSGGTITYSVVSGPATISGSTVTLTGTGTVVLQASQVASGSYIAGIQTAGFNVSAGNPPTISFIVPNHAYGDVPFTVSATSNSAGAFTYSVVSGPATISGSTVTLAGAGTVVLQASQVAAGAYTAGTQTTTLSVATESQIIRFAAPASPVIYGVAAISLSASSTSGLPVTFSVLSGPASVNGGTLTVTGAGTVVVAANQSGNVNYAAASQVTQSIVVSQASQTISFMPPTTPVTYGVSPITLSASATSGLSVAFSVVSGPGTISGSTLTVTGAGTIQIAANQGGNANYAAAPKVTQSIVVNLPPSFTVSGIAVSVTPGATTGNTATITVTPSGGFTGSVALTAAVTASPVGAQDLPTLTFGSTSPVSITGASAVTATLTVSTTAAASGSLTVPERPGTRWTSGDRVVFACLMLFVIPAKRRRLEKMLGLLVFFAILTGAVVGCGGGGNEVKGTGNPGTTAGNYTVTVTAASGNTTTQGTVSVTVQ